MTSFGIDKVAFERSENKTDHQFEKSFPTDKLQVPQNPDPKAKYIVLVECGSFSPPTLAHLRLFEICRDAAKENGYTVLGGYFSPVGDTYAKKGLVSAPHRVEMLKESCKSSDWLMVDSWESEQSTYQRTAVVLDHFEKQLNKPNQGYTVEVSLICGADLLGSFVKPDVWADEDIREIVKRKLWVLTREDVPIEESIWGSDLLYSLRNDIIPISNRIANAISSTKIRQFLARGLSIKYVVADDTIAYIYKHGLYDAKEVQ